jgi:hypothetical protein
MFDALSAEPVAAIRIDNRILAGLQTDGTAKVIIDNILDC